MDTTNQLDSRINTLFIDDPEEQGLRILAKIIARTITKTRKTNTEKEHNPNLNNLPAPGDGK